MDQGLFKHVISPGLIEDSQGWYPGLSCFSEPRLSLRRWHFWGDGFKKATQESSGLSEECRNVARKAATLMEAIEESIDVLDRKWNRYFINSKN
jgi:hypothetical protein